jgi:multicomponent Na+:H+ antiporter subunit E
MSASRVAAAPSAVRAVLTRGVVFFGLWVTVRQSSQAADLAFGALVALGATSASLALLPPAAGSVLLGRLLRQVPRLMWESVVAGLDVARRAFHPRLPLCTGFVDVPLTLSPGLARNTFATITSLLPGTVPVDDSADGLVYHCLDTTQPVLQALQQEERWLGAVLLAERRDV